MLHDFFNDKKSKLNLLEINFSSDIYSVVAVHTV